MMFKLCFSALESDCEAALVDPPKKKKCGAAKAAKTKQLLEEASDRAYIQKV